MITNLLASMYNCFNLCFLSYLFLGCLQLDVIVNEGNLNGSLSVNEGLIEMHNEIHIFAYIHVLLHRESQNWHNSIL